MLKDILPCDLYNIINNKIAIGELSEIRIRQDKPIVVFIKSQPYYIYQNGITCNINLALYATQDMIADIIYKASDFSIYSINEQIKQGYIILPSGIRIGIAGTFVYENNQIKTITNWTSLNIRIPHYIKNASLCAFDDIVSNNEIKNALIISPPGAGKTTFIRDFINQLSERNYCLNVCILDERGEISCDMVGIGIFCDVLRNVDKSYGFMCAIRSLNPSVIVTDEIGSEDDINSLISAMNCGVKVIATIHANNLDELRRKEFFCKLPNYYFQRYVLLSNREGPGTFEGVYNEKFSRIVRW